ncbi:hypothetical protein F2Q69_00020896 [Brassica cretica]|uniref:Uncharacterized protein n=1 Tax=Brassica cretica TaxID=69181 RepID=A0A8S9QA72_BRACR|nr:hypothetical protein F2Q69_00020896 [Brassica cretica]
MVDSATEPPVAAFRSCALESNKLQNLAGQRSDVLENLSPIVRARVDALKDIQMRGTIRPTQKWDVMSWSIWDHGQQAQCTRAVSAVGVVATTVAVVATVTAAVPAVTDVAVAAEKNKERKDC